MWTTPSIELAKPLRRPALAGRSPASVGRRRSPRCKKARALDRRPADYFYQLVAARAVRDLRQDENRARNLAILSQLLNTFQSYYHFTVITSANREWLRLQFFNSFLRLLHEGGINEYEDPDQPFPKGHVQVMTIHQAKGLEFPVVVVGSLHARSSRAPSRSTASSGPSTTGHPSSPRTGSRLFDRMRLHYVAFSRPQKVLVLTAHEPPEGPVRPDLAGAAPVALRAEGAAGCPGFKLRERMPVKKTYSFTGDLKVYETCPRQYQFFREYDFTPSRSAVIFFGLLVHQTIEDIHRIVLDGKLDTLDELRIRELLRPNLPVPRRERRAARSATRPARPPSARSSTTSARTATR